MFSVVLVPGPYQGPWRTSGPGVRAKPLGAAPEAAPARPLPQKLLLAAAAAVMAAAAAARPRPRRRIRGPSYPKLPPNVPRDAVQATYFEPYRFLLVRLAAHAHFMSGGAIRWETVGAPLPRPLSRSSWT